MQDKNDTRALIVQELVDTEKSYVESLDILVNVSKGASSKTQMLR